MRRGTHEADGLATQPLEIHPRHRCDAWRRGQERKVKVSPAQRLAMTPRALTGRLPSDNNRRILSLERCQAARHVERGEPEEHAEVHRSGDHLPGRGNGGRRRFHRRQDISCAREERFSLLRESDPSPSDEQGRLKLVLQLAHRHGHRRLDDAGALRSGSETPRLGDGDEVLKLMRLHRRSIASRDVYIGNDSLEMIDGRSQDDSAAPAGSAGAGISRRRHGTTKEARWCTRPSPLRTPRWS